MAGDRIVLGLGKDARVRDLERLGYAMDLLAVDFAGQQVISVVVETT